MKNTFLKKCLQRSVLTALAAFALVSGRVEAAGPYLTWDPLMSTTAGTDGSGTWDTTTTNWYNATTPGLSAWVSTDFADIGVGTTSGNTITVGSGISAQGVEFLKSGYTLTGSALNLTFASSSGGLNTDAVYLGVSVNAEIDNSLTLGTSTQAAFDINSGTSSTLTLTGGATTVNTASSIVFTGVGATNLTAGTYMGGTVVVGAGTVTVSGSSAKVAAGSLQVASFSNATFVVNSSVTGTAVSTGTGSAADEIGLHGGSGTIDLKAGTVSSNSTGGLQIVADSIVNGTLYAQGLLKVEGGAMTTAGTIYVNYAGIAAGQTGAITVTGGTLTAPKIQFGNGSTAYGTTTAGSLTVSGGNLYLGAGGIVENSVHPVTDTITLSGGAIGATAAWNSAMNMTLSTGGVGTFQAANATGTAFNIGLSGNLTGGGSLAKTGTGALTVSGTNAYTGGTLVNAGSFIVGTATALQSATGNIAVQGGTFSSSVSTTLGSSLGLTSGAITPGGAGTAATLTLASGGNFTMSGGSLTLDLGASTLASDQIVASGAGTFTITGGTLNLNLLSGFAYSTSYAVLSGFASGGVSSLAITGYDTTDYTASLSNSGLLTFAAVPEPSTWALMAGGLGLLVLLQRRKSRISSL